MDQFHIKILHIRWTASENEITFWKKWPSHLRVKTNLCTWHDGLAPIWCTWQRAAMWCAKFCSNHFVRIWMRAKHNFGLLSKWVTIWWSTISSTSSEKCVTQIRLWTYKRHPIHTLIPGTDLLKLLQVEILNAFLRKNCLWIIIHWSVFLKVQLTISHQRFKVMAWCHNRYQTIAWSNNDLLHWCTYALPGLNSYYSMRPGDIYMPQCESCSALSAKFCISIGHNEFKKSLVFFFFFFSKNKI